MQREGCDACRDQPAQLRAVHPLPGLEKSLAAREAIPNPNYRHPQIGTHSGSFPGEQEVLLVKNDSKGEEIRAQTDTIFQCSLQLLGQQSAFRFAFGIGSTG